MAREVKHSPLTWLLITITFGGLLVALVAGILLRGDLESPTQSHYFIFIVCFNLFNGGWTMIAAVYTLAILESWESCLATVKSLIMWLIITVVLWSISLGMILGECIPSWNAPYGVCGTWDNGSRLNNNDSIWMALIFGLLVVVLSIVALLIATCRGRRRGFRSKYYP